MGVHDGHRERMKSRFVEAGLMALTIITHLRCCFSTPFRARTQMSLRIGF